MNQSLFHQTKLSRIATQVLGWAFFMLIIGCTNEASVSTEHWGELNGEPVWHYTIANPNGASMKVTNYGGIITSVNVPDKNGKLEDVVLGFDNLKQYQDPNPCFGATIGRFANRIKQGTFVIDSITYNLDTNDGKHCIHGANEFNTVVWESEIVREASGVGVRLHYLSVDGTKGFPGNLDAIVTYLFSPENEVIVRFEATTDKATHVSMTQHSYFNLNGVKSPVYDHLIRIDASRYTEIDDEVVPTGVLAPVENTDWDLTSLTRIGDNIHKLNNNGYHFCYVFDKEPGAFKKVIEVYEPESGRTLEVSTSQPSVQFYSGNTIDNQLKGKQGIQYRPHMAFCLETQHLPDSPNKPQFPSTLLKPGEKYLEQVVYKFGVKK